MSLPESGLWRTNSRPTSQQKVSACPICCFRLSRTTFKKSNRSPLERGRGPSEKLADQADRARRVSWQEETAVLYVSAQGSQYPCIHQVDVYSYRHRPISVSIIVFCVVYVSCREMGLQVYEFVK